MQENSNMINLLHQAYKNEIRKIHATTTDLITNKQDNCSITTTKSIDQTAVLTVA